MSGCPNVRLQGSLAMKKSGHNARFLGVVKLLSILSIRSVFYLSAQRSLFYLA